MPTFRAPGRVNLIGDHTDYNEGLVLPMAIDRECTVAVAPAGAGLVTARSRELPGLACVRADGSDEPAAVDPPWARFVAAAVRAVTQAGARLPGAYLEIASTVPTGSGLSSSSALGVALTLALGDLGGLRLPIVETARLARDVEVQATGVPCGLMDQLSALGGRAGHVLLIDCRTFAIRPVPIAPGIAVVVVHSGLPRTLAGSDYAVRRAECEAVAARFGAATLRDVTLAQAASSPRARHVVGENARVAASAAALAAGDLGALGALMLASHTSLRDDFEVSTPELDLLVELLVDAGAAGARLTGAGFGGCVVAVAAPSDAGAILEHALRRYRDSTGLPAQGFVASAVDGAATSSRGARSSSARTPRR